VLKDAALTIGKLIDKHGVSFIASVGGDGFPNAKAMLAPRKREGIKTFWFTTNTSSIRKISKSNEGRRRQLARAAALAAGFR
jgi:general stress protein 26